MKFRGGEFSTGTTGNFQPELTRRVIGLNRCVGLEPNCKFRPLLLPP